MKNCGMVITVMYNVLFVENTIVYISSEHCVIGDLHDGVEE